MTTKTKPKTDTRALQRRLELAKIAHREKKNPMGSHLYHHGKDVK